MLEGAGVLEGGVRLMGSPGFSALPGPDMPTSYKPADRFGKFPARNRAGNRLKADDSCHSSTGVAWGDRRLGRGAIAKSLFGNPLTRAGWRPGYVLTGPVLQVVRVAYAG